jgi:periplasmic divalent cation tolerance protein
MNFQPKEDFFQAKQTGQSDYYVVYVTCEHEKQADALATSLVKESLAACVNTIGPITSTYRWEGKVEQGKEWLLMIKTAKPALEALNKRIHEIHTYTVPEVIALPIEAGSSKYLNWLGENVHL